MFRLTRLTRQALRTPLVQYTTIQNKRILPALTNFKNHFSNTPCFNFADKNKNIANEEEDIETIDPKDFPELYPDERDEEIDTEWFVDGDEDQLSEKDFIPLWQRRAVGDHLEDRAALKKMSEQLMETGNVTADSLQNLLEENKMDNVVVIDVRQKCDWTDYMIVASSEKGDKYIGSVADQISSVVKKAIQSNADTKQHIPHIEGRNDKSGWILVDLGRIVIHLFTPELRETYDIEGLWNSVSTDPSEPMKIEDN